MANTERSGTLDVSGTLALISYIHFKTGRLIPYLLLWRYGGFKNISEDTNLLVSNALEKSSNVTSV